MDYWFYLSYSRVDDSPYIKKFYGDLSVEVRQRMGIPEHEVGYFDGTRIEPGMRWDTQILDALQNSRVLIPMLSRGYLHSEFCGKEWQFFRFREEATINALPSAAGYRSAIMPVLWQPEEYLPKPLPAAISNLQYTHPRLGEDYVRHGLLRLMKLHKHRDEYYEFLYNFANELCDTARSSKLLRLENPPPINELTSAFSDLSFKATNTSSVIEQMTRPTSNTEDGVQSELPTNVEASAQGKLAGSAAKEKLKIFISYRRTDSEGFAGRLFDQLSSRFGEDQIFMDIDTIEPGEDFVEVIEKAVSSCNILIAVIGKGWLTGVDELGRRRLENPDDFVRVEILTALERNIRVIPILVQGAVMPRAGELPDVLAKLARRNALELSSARWKYDTDRLITAIEKVLGK